MIGGNRMRVVGIGHLLFALGFAIIGAIQLGTQDFILSQEAVPKDVPWPHVLACISGAILLLTGLGTFLAPIARRAMLALTAFMLFWTALAILRLVPHPNVEDYWPGENFTLVAGGWLIACALAGRSDRSVHWAQIIFGIGLVPVGLSHFVYLKGAAEMIPSWLPFHVPLTCLTGAAHIAAGVAIVFGIVPRLAATLEAIMETLFTLLIWGPIVAGAPTSHDNWANIFISTALSGAAWAVAESYRNTPWGFARSMRTPTGSSA
jgi:uncharacterized membrane protein